MSATTPTPTVAAAACFHCGLSLSAGSYPVEIDGAVRETCCRGCQAVAQTIVGNGLTAYYRYRQQPLGRREPPAGSESTRKLFDLPEVQQSFVRAHGANEKEASQSKNDRYNSLGMKNPSFQKF